MSQVVLPNQGSSRTWTLCSYPGCPGEAAPQHLMCYLHLGAHERTAYLAMVAEGRTPLTLAGLRINAKQLAEVLAAMSNPASSRSGSPRPYIPSHAYFDETVFTEYVDAQHVTFAQSCLMAKAVFEQGVNWNGSRFGGGLNLQRATIERTAKFGNVAIEGHAAWAGLRASARIAFVNGQVSEDLDLRWAESRGVWLSYTTIAGNALMKDANFALSEEGEQDSELELARLDGMDVAGTADFSGVRFPYETTIGGYADMPPATFRGQVLFEGCTFGLPTVGGRHLLQRLDLAAATLSGCTFYGRVSFAGCRSESPLVIDDLKVIGATASTDHDENEYLFPRTELDLTDLSLERGGRLTDIYVEGSCAIHCARLEGELETTRVSATGAVEVRGTTFAYAPLEIGGHQRLMFVRCLFQRGGVLSCATPDLSFSECDARQPLLVTSSGEPASLTALDRTNVEHFVLAGVDLAHTTFVNVSNLDRLRIHGTPMFLRSPTRLGLGRQIVLDEATIRAARSRRWRALLPETRASSTTEPLAVAATYRALRKNREDGKDEPGGADFYYGEMEMRRRAASSWSVEKWLLTVYWLISGYALRAWRALASLLCVLAVGGFLLERYGYTANSPGGVLDASLALAQVALALARTPEGLNACGTMIVISTRILCPALLVLAVLALRSRVKR